MNILEEAEKIVNGPRRDSYGHPKKNFADIATCWSTYLGTEIKPQDVAMMMTMIKVLRFKRGNDRDSVLDIAGYAACTELVMDGWGDGKA